MVIASTYYSDPVSKYPITFSILLILNKNH